MTKIVLNTRSLLGFRTAGKDVARNGSKDYKPPKYA
jgi:hypothetical protein